MVSYFYLSNGIYGFTSSYVKCNENDDIYTEDFIENLKKQIKIKFSFNDIVIQNIIPLND
jgi:hypothetical protein